MRTFKPIAVLAAFAGLAISGCSLNVNGDESVTHEFGSDYFGAGGFLNLTDPVEGDAFLAGGRVATAGEVGGDLVAAGGEVSIGGSVGDDLYAAGGDVKVDAMVHGNVRVGGGDIGVGPATVMAGSATLTGGRVNFEGNTHGYLQATGGTVRISGQVHRDAEVRAEELVIAPETQIGGRLIYHGPTAPVVPEGAVIAGGVEFHEVSHGDYLHDDHGPVREAVHWVGTALWFAGVFCVGALFLVLFPGLSSRAAETIARDPLQSLGLGLAVLVCVPFVAVVLLITIVGIPLALLMVPLYLLLLFLGWIVAAMFVGKRGLALARGTGTATIGWQLFSLLLALVALAIVRHIPFVGGLIAFLALIAGIGALVRQAWAGRQGAPAAS
jgi:cytoskeletal protein CcmA (bactofilin family)